MAAELPDSDTCRRLHVDEPFFGPGVSVSIVDHHITFTIATTAAGQLRRDLPATVQPVTAEPTDPSTTRDDINPMGGNE
ncbi:hypothetical protein QQX10_10625 [Demequina sp. SYSU T00039]|uniref:Uncharacterized protein n=1 Tax=Demequina lignilytica TaxID=3051663 RepID=A0AAW7M9T1_9MICO|nr:MULTISPECIES: hypothetical protein [unclassified Demequina]MDN4478643.1 hypothetical protein [Demequina sp. SYSU T00039-1]MDN4488621.1 hypothetical protein [Demequina sp. SYSU T00039]